MRRSILTLTLLGLAGVLSAATFSAADVGSLRTLPVSPDYAPQWLTESQSAGSEIGPIDANAWWPKESVPGGTTGRYRVMSCTSPDSGVLYLIGGQAPSPVNTGFRYNISTNTWSAIANMPGTNSNQTATFWVDNGGGTDSSGIFIVGRYLSVAPTYARTSYYWRRATNTWDTIPRPPGPLDSTYISGAMCAVVGDSLYILTRVSASVCSLYKYSIRQGTWTSIGASPLYQFYGAISAYGGKIWTLGSYPLAPATPTSFQCYDPQTRAWTVKTSPSWADSAGGNSPHLVGIPGGKLVAYGGGDGWYPRRGVNVYDTAYNTWMPEDDILPVPTLGGGYGLVDSAGTWGPHLACGEISYPSPLLNCNLHWRGLYTPPPPNDARLDAIVTPVAFY